MSTIGQYMLCLGPQLFSEMSVELWDTKVLWAKMQKVILFPISVAA